MSEKSITLEIAETALCIWEWYNSPSHGKAEAEWCQYCGGTAELRTYMLKLAEVILDREKELQREYGYVGWNEPYDWEIIPRIMNAYLFKLQTNTAYSEALDELRACVYDAYMSDHAEDLATLKEFDVDWVKTYYSSGTMRVSARSEEAALEIADSKVGDCEGSMQYAPNRNVFEAREVSDEE